MVIFARNLAHTYKCDRPYLNIYIIHGEILFYYKYSKYFRVSQEFLQENMPKKFH